MCPPAAAPCLPPREAGTAAPFSGLAASPAPDGRGGGILPEGYVFTERKITYIP